MENKIFYTVVITSSLVAVIIIFFIISVIRYHRRYINLQKERIFAQIMMQEEERKRIANDLHDSIAPMLSTVKLYMYSINIDNQEDKALLDKASGYVDDTINNLREISYNLLPASLDRNDLYVTVKEYINRFSNKHFLKINFDYSADTLITKELEIHLFRIFQEVIHNTMKHAQATTLSLYITNMSDGLYIITEDDGKGFDLEETRKTSGGLGLKSIENRCEMINADLVFVTALGQGCKIVIKIAHA